MNIDINEIAKLARGLFIDMLDRDDKKEIINMEYEDIYAEYAPLMNDALDQAISEYAENNKLEEKTVMEQFNDNHGMSAFSIEIDKGLDALERNKLAAININDIAAEAVKIYKQNETLDEEKFMDIVCDILDAKEMDNNEVLVWLDKNCDKVLDKGNEFYSGHATAAKLHIAKVKTLRRIYSGKKLAAYKMSDQEFNGYVEDCKNEILKDEELLKNVKYEINNYIDANGNVEDIDSTSMGTKPARILNNAILEFMEKKYENTSLYYSLYDFSGVSQNVFHAIMRNCIEDVQRIK